MNTLDVADVKDQITKFIASQAPANGVVVGISGGVDSALVVALCVAAIGAERTFGIFMPESADDISSTIKQYVDRLGIACETVPIRPIFDAYRQHGDITDDRRVNGNLKARIRMSLLYSRSNAQGLVVMGTGNRSELLAGYFTKYGDGGVDFLPIGDLYKTDVWQLAKHLGVPEAIITQPPSAGLWAGQTDEAELGISYQKLDQVLREHYDKGTTFDEINLPGLTTADIEKVKQRTLGADFKLTMPPLCQLKK